MIDEDVLRGLLAEAADSAPPPGHLPEDLLAHLDGEALTVTEPRFSGMSWSRTVAIAAAVLVAVIGITAVFATDGGGGDDSATTAMDSTEVAAPVTTVAPAAQGGFDAQLDYGDGDSMAAAPVPAPPDLRERASGGNAATASEGAAPAAPGDTAKVIKTGSMSIEIDRGGFDGSLDLITTKAAGLGGYVAQSTTSRAGEHPSGSLILRVPADQFDQFMADLRGLGKVLAEDSRGTDVTGALTDVEARLNALKATRAKLETVLAEADGVDEILLVQDRITGVQTQIEQLEGQKATLNDQVGMASITVSLGEPGAERVDTPVDDDDGLGGAWTDARRRFGDGLEGVVSWSGSAAVVAIVLALIAVAARLGWSRLRRYFI